MTDQAKEGGKGDFTPGANLSPTQIKAVLAFVTCKGKTNEETIANMVAFFGAAKP